MSKQEFEQEKKQSRGERPCPEHHSSLLSNITFSWVDDLVMSAWWGKIGDGDLYKMPEEDSSERVYDTFKKEWQLVNKTFPNDRYGLLRTILRVHKFTATKSMVLDFLVIGFTFSIPYLLKSITTIFENVDNKIADASTLKQVYWWSLGLIIMEVLRLIFTNGNLWMIVRAGLQVRTALMAAMYEKSLVLTGVARQQYSLGRAVNILSSDILRIDTGWTFVNLFWTTPIFIILTFVLVAIDVIGWAWLAGGMVLLVYVPFQMVIIKKLIWYRDRTNELADRRIKMLQEVLFGIRVIKLYSWEDRFQKRVNELRQEELRLIRRMKLVAAISQTLTTSVPTLITVASLVAYAWIYGSVSSSVIFPAMAFFDLLEVPLNYLPITISYTVDALAAIRRVQAFLRAPVLVFEPEQRPDQKEAVLISEAMFAWDDPNNPMKETEEEDEQESSKMEQLEQEKEMAQQRESSLSVPKAGVYDVTTERWIPSTPVPFSALKIKRFAIERGELVAVVGPVGSGKSSLLGCVVGEMFKISGSVSLSGRIGYSSQHAWIQDGSIRENILFGLPMDSQLYNTVIKQCALEPDLANMPDGDHTLIGEKGVNLSGGQKQRLSLARMVYSDPDIALLDDPLSAVDPHVGKVLFRDCILHGHLSTKTRILVTHQLNVLPHVDRIVVMQNGQIEQVGTYEEIINSGTAFATLLTKLAKSEEETKVACSSTVLTVTEESVPVSPSCCPATPQPPPPATGSPESPFPEEGHSGEAVSLAAYLHYAMYCGGSVFLLFALVTGILSEGGRSFSDVWLKWWPEAETNPSFMSDRDFMAGLTWIAVFQTALTWFNGLVFVLGGYFASLALHQKALHRVLRTPIRFFDCTPAGRILNRFSKDMDLLDSNLPEELNNLMCAVSVIASTVVITGICDVRLLAIMPFPLAAGFLLQSIFTAAARQLQHLNVAAYSPLLSHFSTTYTGLSVLRAFRKQAEYVTKHHLLNDHCNRSYYLYVALRRWTSFRSEAIGAFLTLFMSCIGTYFQFSASVYGLALTQALKITRALDWCIKQLAETEISMVSAERVVEYAEALDSEKAMITQVRPSPNWPQHGRIQFINLYVRYRPHLPPVLKSINLEFLPRQRVAIVGRTGAGKSTILSVLFRLVEPTAGQILVDGVDICELGLADLRTRLAIVPQEPVLFAGTMRFNLDPLSEHSDDALWLALEQTHMADTVRRIGGSLGLDMAVMENGDNFSIGQKQLLCLARAVLKKTSVLVLDEATANIDLENDALIQKSLRDNFSSTHTIITIAHRLNTIIDYDKVVVMRAGEVVEFDSPATLASNPHSLFSEMLRESSAHKE